MNRCNRRDVGALCISEVVAATERT